MATPVPNVIALPVPCNTRKAISAIADVEIAERKDEAVKSTMPYVKILFLPCISAILPKGTRNITAAKRYAVATQLNKTASMANSFPIEGRAMLTEEPIKGVRKDARVATSKAELLSTPLSIFIFLDGK
ncbi:MAG: hypothetical protein AUK23_08075 [Deltaproteobacteria bacterium CG2_30_43_15]|nr:MAG: hypothetical protein AUK23_08075 [Deltaproteobacteria bacterium CG2_30_43_15]